MTSGGRSSVAEDLVDEFTRRGRTLACAESLTAGLVSAGIADVPGASAVLRGGAVTYATECKHDVLGVDADLLAERGAVDATVAEQMARGARDVFGADVGVATTGVAGPTEQDGQAVGTVFVAVCWPGESPDLEPRCLSRRFRFPGGRSEVRAAAAEAAWTMSLDVIRADPA